MGEYSSFPFHLNNRGGNIGGRRHPRVFHFGKRIQFVTRKIKPGKRTDNFSYLVKLIPYSTSNFGITLEGRKVDQRRRKRGGAKIIILVPP